VAPAPALPQRALQFPRDLGSHPDTAIEWWYVTGELLAQRRRFGFQLTFFRSRVPTTQTMRSAFAARQLMFAHAALTDVNSGRLLHDQRLARSASQGNVDLATASDTDTHVQLRDWSLHHTNGHYLAQAAGPEFAFTLTLAETQPLLLQGEQGLSRKGPQASQASYYYSLPQLAVSGQLTLAGQTQAVTGRAWLDHEWSQSLLHPDAVGWDWIGINLLDGGALTAFRLRTRSDGALWAGGSYRAAGQTAAQVLAADAVRFTPQRHWTSPATGTRYPVQWLVEVQHQPSQPLQRYLVKAVIDNQELDSRASTGAIYWEGLSELWTVDGQLLGRGYLEMTGYASPLIL